MCVCGSGGGGGVESRNRGFCEKENFTAIVPVNHDILAYRQKQNLDA